MYGRSIRMTWGSLALACALVVVGAGLSGAAQAVLTLSRGETVVALTMADLEAMPQHALVTSNEFTDGEVTYVGPLARDVLARIDLEGVAHLRLTALNDYYIDVPRSDFDRYDVIFAMEADGQRLSRRDKGPLWLMYPISDYPELADPIFNARLIWQVVRVEAL
jgi:hypothetical protein